MIHRCRCTRRHTLLTAIAAPLFAWCLVAIVTASAAAMPATTDGASTRTASHDARGRDAVSAQYELLLHRYGHERMSSAAVMHDDAITVAAHATKAIPAFARKYGLPCSACHTVWPELNNFGQVFRDNGYRLKNERDSPIDQAPGYWPIAARITPQFRIDRTDHQPVDAVAGDANSGKVERTITQTGFDLSGLDLLMIGTLSQRISFGLVPAAESDGSFHLEAAFVRFNDLMNSTWANLKAGKFELDNMISEKRELLLSGNGGFYHAYHFVPAGDATSFGMGDNQIGMELSGHSINSYTRYSVGLFSATDGEVGLAQGKGFDGAVALSQAFEAGALGLERIGVFGYQGNRSTTFETVDGEPVPGSGTANKSFYRAGVTGDFYLGNLELLPLWMHASDDAVLGAGGAAVAGARNPTWNSALVEAHYYIGHQFALLGRREAIRMSTQVTSDVPSNFGNVDATALGFRWYPIMLARDGLAVHGEYAWTNTIGTAPWSGLGSGLPPLDPGTSVKSSSIFLALDFAF